MYADFVRVFRLAPLGSALGLAACAVVVALGVWAAAVWHRAGEVRFAVTLCGVASLLASPVSWLHHFVWIVPLAFSLVELTQQRMSKAEPVLPTWLAILGWLFVGWVIVSPYRRLPNGADLELQWTAGQHLLASVTAILGTALLIAAIVVGRRLVSDQSTAIGEK